MTFLRQTHILPAARTVTLHRKLLVCRCVWMLARGAVLLCDPQVLSAYQQLPGTRLAYVDVDYSKQPSFVAGVLLYWLATCVDALPDHPVPYNNTNSHKIQYAVDTDVD